MSVADPAPRGKQRRRSRSRVVGLLIGWALLLAWVALVGWNIATAGFPAPLSRLIALPSLPGLPPLAPTLAAQAATSLFALMIALFLYLCALTFIPTPSPARVKPALPEPPAAEPPPATVAPPAHTAPAIEPAPPPALAEAASPPPPVAPAEQSAPASDAAPDKRLVFISHASGDNAFGYALTDWLHAQLGPDWIVWYDSHGAPDATGDWPDGIPPASDWMQEIQRQVMACAVFVVIETKAAMESYWVQREVELAWTRKPGASVESGLVVVPVRRETCELLPLLSLVQYVDYQPSMDEVKAQRDLLYVIRNQRTVPAPLVTVGPPFDLSELRPADHFIGRAADVEWVLRRLTGAADAQLANIAAANGQGGIGKTALAAEVVRRLMTTLAFPDGIAALDCRDQHSEADALGLLQTALSRFRDARQKPQDQDFATLGDVAQRLLGGKRALVVFDNVEFDLPASKLVAPLRTAGAAILLTSRAPIAALPNSASLRLDLLPEDDALALFANAYGRALSETETAAARRTVRALGRHTLAVKLAAANAGSQSIALSSMASAFERAQLREAWLEEEEGSEIAVTYVLKTSVEAMSPGGQRLFAALGAFASADIGRKAALALAEALGDDENGAERSLRWILDLRLADPAEIELPGGEEADRQRLRLHPLTQAYARDLFAGRRALPNAAPWDDAQRERADRALANWYGAYTNAVDYDSGINYLILTPDEANITGALGWALAHGDDRAAARICDGMRSFWRNTGRTQAGLRYLPRGAEAAGRIADQSGEREDRLIQAYITGYHGDILQNVGRLPEAEAIFKQDLDLRRAIKDRRGEGVVLSRLGSVARLRGRLEEAADYFQQSLPILRETQDRRGEGADLSLLGQVALARGRLEEAAAYFEQSLPIRRETQDRQGEGFDLMNLGQVALFSGDTEAAENLLRQALPILRETQDRQNEGVTLATLGQIAEARGQYAEAAQAYRAGIAVLREVGDRINIAAILEALGAVLLQHSDDRVGGVAAYVEAIALWQAIGLADREQEAREEALALGCRADELPPPSEGNAAG